MTSRDRILAKLRANPAPFPANPPPPATYLPVTHSPDAADLLARFTLELERLTGKVHVAADADAAIACVLAILGSDTAALAWDRLPLPGLDAALDGRGIRRIVPNARHDERASVYQHVEPLRVGITGADAALATTGTLVLVTNAGQGRLPSLLPPVHVALLARDRLYANLESWLAADGGAALAASNSVAFITGPSRTSDIEMQTIFGVHGPGVVHVVVF